MGSEMCIRDRHRMGDMIDIANVVLFLCSKEASFINGQVIKVDGGR